MFVVLIEVGAVVLEALGKVQWRPVAGFVDVALMGLRIAETFGQQGAETVQCFTLLRQAAHGQTHAAAGLVGLAAHFQN